MYNIKNAPYNDKLRFYFDWAATAPPDAADGNPQDASFGNPSSRHLEGRAAKEMLEKARSRCASALGVAPETLYFTSGGSESNAIAIHSLLLRPKKVKLLYSVIEHPSVMENCLILKRLGFDASAIDAEKDGRISPETLNAALERHPDTRFAALMAVNNETGAVMDIKELVSFIRSKQKTSTFIHCDLCQCAGKIPFDITISDIDSASVSAHKIGGQRGAGLLYLKKPIETLYSGGDQEKHVRPGTENLAGAISMAVALENRLQQGALNNSVKDASERMKLLIRGLKKLKNCALIPHDREEEDRRFSPWILQVRFSGIPGEVMVRALDNEGFAVSTGSACSSAKQERPVLEAMGLDKSARLEGIRISQGWSTDIQSIEALLEGVKRALRKL